MTDAEVWYNSPDLEEYKHIHTHVLKNNLDVKTLDVKILELREEPDNL